jgi:adenylate kinase
VAANTPLGSEIDSYISRGMLVPDELIIDVLVKKLDKNPATGGIVLDGFPRTTEQAEALDIMLDKRGEKIDLMIEIAVEEERLFERLVRRGAVSGRTDDTPETIRKRLAVYHEKTEVVKQFYLLSERYHSADNNGSIEECFAAISGLINRI